MSNEEGLLKDKIQTIIRRSIRSMAAARLLLSADDYDFAISRAYYGAFYAIEAVLLSRNLTFSRHSSVIGTFNQHFVKTGIFPKEFSRFITDLFRERQSADYDHDAGIQPDEAEREINNAEKIVYEVIQFLGHEGYLDPADEDFYLTGN